MRAWLYGLLTTPSLPYSAHTRVFAKRTMRSSLEDCPYIVYKLGNNTSVNLSETSRASSQFFQIYVHDFTDVQSGDYLKIDEVIAALKLRLQNASSPEDGVLTVDFLETSQDLNDETLGTVFRYARFIATLGR